MITHVQHIEEYYLKLTFSDGTVKTIDFYPLLKRRAIYKPYLKMPKFLRFKIDCGSLVWPGNTLDFHHSFLKSLPEITLIPAMK